MSIGFCSPQPLVSSRAAVGQGEIRSVGTVNVGVSLDREAQGGVTRQELTDVGQGFAIRSWSR